MRIAAIHIQHWPRAAEPPPSARNLASYYYIAEHYRFALTRVFDVLKFDQAVLLEDDMEISPDFFSFFSALVPVLQLRHRAFLDVACLRVVSMNAESLIHDHSTPAPSIGTIRRCCA